MSADAVETPVVANFFTGCGGLDLGFERAGFDIALASEVNGEPAAGIVNRDRSASLSDSNPSPGLLLTSFGRRAGGGI